MIHGRLRVSKTLSGGLQSQNFHLYTDILNGLFHCADIWTEDAKATVALGTNQDSAHLDDILGDKWNAHIKHLFIPKYSGWSKGITDYCLSCKLGYFPSFHGTSFSLERTAERQNYSDSDVCIWQTFSKIN